VLHLIQELFFFIILYLEAFFNSVSKFIYKHFVNNAIRLFHFCTKICENSLYDEKRRKNMFNLSKYFRALSLFSPKTKNIFRKIDKRRSFCYNDKGKNVMF